MLREEACSECGVYSKCETQYIPYNMIYNLIYRLCITSQSLYAYMQNNKILLYIRINMCIYIYIIIISWAMVHAVCHVSHVSFFPAGALSPWPAQLDSRIFKKSGKFPFPAEFPYCSQSSNKNISIDFGDWPELRELSVSPQSWRLLAWSTTPAGRLFGWLMMEIPW